MTPLESMTRLIAIADRFMSTMADAQSEEELDQYEEAQLAVSVATAMLNTALPIARFRCFVQVDADSKKRGRIKDEYTICAPSIHGILAGLIGLNLTVTDIHATLWEQKQMGASMLSGYQGPSKNKRYRAWVESLFEYEAPVKTDGEE